MTIDQVHEALRRYQQQSTETRRGGKSVFVAWFSEIPNCLVEAEDRAGAIAELERLAPGYLMRLQGDGAEIPIPIQDRTAPVTQHYAVTLRDDASRSLDSRTVGHVAQANVVMGELQEA